MQHLYRRREQTQHQSLLFIRLHTVKLSNLTIDMRTFLVSKFSKDVVGKLNFLLHFIDVATCSPIFVKKRSIIMCVFTITEFYCCRDPDSAHNMMKHIANSAMLCISDAQGTNRNCRKLLGVIFVLIIAT